MTDIELLPRDPQLKVPLVANPGDAESQSAKEQGEDVRTFDHLFELEHIDAINAALACNRPLLLTGEPGVGKTQLARAAAKALGRAYVRFTVDSRTEARDLLWEFDTVARLAQAQLAAAMELEGSKLFEDMAVENFVRPGPLWWAFEWSTAKARKGAVQPSQVDEGSPEKGVVILIDEIDKAEIDVPNGLLEALGEGSFQPDGHIETVRMGTIPPLVIITSNRERELPDAFVRRCLEIRMTLPAEAGELKRHLIKRGEAHHPGSEGDDGFALAADMLVADRQSARKANHHPLPGQAEYLDLIEAAVELSRRQGEAMSTILERIRPYILRKGRQGKATREEKAD